jgi:multiple antibiotic resistance protein
MNWSVFGVTFVTLLVIMDPIGAVPIFVTLTQTYSSDARRRAAVRAAAAAGAVVLVFALAGEAILRYVNVSIQSVSIAGGLLLLLLSLEMLRGIDFDEGPRSGDVALVPLATPLVAGPGAIATAMVLARQHPSTWDRVAVVLGILAAVAVIGLTLVAAEFLTRRVPPATINFLTRVLGLLIAAIGVELVLRGVHASFPR